jgi:hypothetical protein
MNQVTRLTTHMATPWPRGLERALVRIDARTPATPGHLATDLAKKESTACPCLLEHLGLRRPEEPKPPPAQREIVRAQMNEGGWEIEVR